VIVSTQRTNAFEQRALFVAIDELSALRQAGRQR
jgi:hypothetical protein